MTASSLDTRGGLLRAVLADPRDTLARLVYADWLDEYGDKTDACQARFIRRQCDPDEPPRNVPLPVLAGLEPFVGPTPHLYATNTAPGRNEAVFSYRGGMTFVYRGGMTFVYRLGMLDEVRLTLAAFVGGPCERCDVSPGVRRYATNGGDWVEDDCNECGGTGMAPGLARAIFAAHPVTRVVLTDRVPMPDGDEATETDWVRWLVNTTDAVVASADDRRLPQAIAENLPRVTRGGEYRYSFPSRQAALDALSTVAAPNYGRGLVGLPPLPGGAA